MMAGWRKAAAHKLKYYPDYHYIRRMSWKKKHPDSEAQRWFRLQRHAHIRTK